MQYDPPNPHDYPACAHVWVQESARGLQQLLGLVHADPAREHQRAAVDR